MPNHVTNKLTILGNEKEINEVLELVRSDDRLFDFNNIIPTPDDIFQGSVGSEEEKKYSGKTWYTWNRENWGTKWNAYDIKLENDTIIFDTAWSTPLPVITALSKLFQNISFELEYADEDMGHNLGVSTFNNGDIVETTEFYQGSERAIKFACYVKGYDYDQYLEDMQEMGL